MDLKPKAATSSREIAIAGSIVLLLLLNITPLNDVFRNGFSFVFSPIHYSANSVSLKIKDSLDSISQISTLKEENNRLKLENAERASQNQSVLLLLEENKTLKEELELGGAEEEIIEASVLGVGVGGVDDYLIVNMGSRDGVSKGDVVKVGNIFIGVVSDVERDSSRVLLPNSGTSYLQVFITDGNSQGLSIDELNQLYNNDASLSKIESGVAVGSSSGIVVENLATDADIKKGDAVIINDSKVNRFLYLGSVNEVIDDPAASQKKAFIEVPLNYQEINFVFISINND